jgi:purine-nucleoside phosphorylase
MLLLAAVREELGELAGEVVGIGAVIAAARAATLLERRKPARVILIGTAGSYPGGPPVGTAIVSQMIGMSFGVAAMGLGYVPRPPAPVPADEDMMARVHLERHNVLTAGAVTTDLTLANRLSDGWTVEHLEAFGVAIACQQVGVRFIAVLGISNQVGPEAHVQWLTHRDAAQEAARQAVLPLLG